MKRPSQYASLFLSREEEHKHLILAKQGDQESVQRLLDSIKGMMHKECKHWYPFYCDGFEYDDLYQSATHGALIAIDKYDLVYAGKIKFLTYATFWIRQKLREMRATVNLVNVPVKDFNKLRKLVLSLDATKAYTTDGSDTSTWADDLEAKEADPSISHDVSVILAGLTERSRRWVERRYMHDETLQAIGDSEGLTREAVRRSLEKTVHELKEQYSEL